MASIDAQTPHANPDIFAPTPNLAGRKLADSSFVIWGILATGIGLSVLIALVFTLFHDGGSRLNPSFFLSFTSPDPKIAGVYAAWVGSLLVIACTSLVAIPLGVGAGIYLEEYAPKNAVTDILEVTVNNLAGIPSIVFGLLGLGVFVYAIWSPSELWLGHSIASAGLTLALLILPVIIVATREAVRAVPRGVREAALAVGATKFQATSHHVLPYSMPGVFTGVIIGLSRALGETAPLIMVGVPVFAQFLPFFTPADVGQTIYDTEGNERIISQAAMMQSWLPWTPDGQGWLSQAAPVMPMQMFSWTSQPVREFQTAAAAAGIVLLAITLLLNGTAIYLRYRLRRSIKW